MLVRWVRFVCGVLSAGILGYLMVPNANGYVLLLMIAVIGLISGIIMASCWSVVLAPAALLGAAELWYRVGCATCSGRGDDGAWVVFVLTMMALGTGAVGAAAGTLVGRRLPAG